MAQIWRGHEDTTVKILNNIIKIEPGYGSWRISVSSGDPEADHPDAYCKIRIWSPTRGISIKLPNWVLKPHSIRVFPQNWDASTIERLGRNWYDHYTPREYGVWYSDHFLNVMYGVQSHDSSTEQNIGWFIPWLDTRHIRQTFMDENHNKIIDAPEFGKKYGEHSWDDYRAVVNSIPRTNLSFKDYDGELIEVSCYINEREWRYGTGWFEWIGRLKKPLIQRTVDLEFSKEVGRRKETWKGGTIGAGCEIKPGESIYDAFCRYAADNELSDVIQL